MKDVTAAYRGRVVRIYGTAYRLWEGKQYRAGSGGNWATLEAVEKTERRRVFPMGKTCNEYSGY